MKPIWVLKWSKWKGEMYLEVSTGLTAINMKVSGKNDNANVRGPLIHSDGDVYEGEWKKSSVYGIFDS